MTVVKPLILGTVLLALLTVLGCAQPGTHIPIRQVVEDGDIIARNHEAAETMAARVPWLKEGAPLLTATFVNVNGLESSSALGRMAAEQVASRFSQLGYTMLELKMRNNIFIKDGAGEFILSRQVRDISRSHNAAGVIAGVYAVGKDEVYISARLIRAADSLILAAVDYSLPLGPDVRAMLAAQ